MPKLAIYVPKKAKKAIDRWRKTINFSQVFMRALEREIRERERAAAAEDSQVAIAARHYRQQMSEHSDALVSLGHREGVRLVLECHLEPEPIQEMVSWADRPELGVEERSRVREWLGKSRDSLLKSASNLGYREKTHPGLESDLCRGVVLGVSDAWSRVCEEMNQL